MLVLSRKSGQKLIIADNIEVVILDIKGDAVKIGIDAPKHVPIYRDEIYQEILKANQQAMAAPATINLAGLVTLPVVQFETTLPNQNPT